MSTYKGITWGQTNFTETALKLQTMDENPKSLFSIDFQSVNNATVNKNDIILEANPEIQNDQDYMCQVRFHVQIPKEENAGEDEDNMSVEDDEKDKEKQENDGEKKEKKENYTQMIYKKILEKAKIGSFGGQSIITLNEVTLAVPRGKYTIDFYQRNFRFHGQTYNFAIDYKNITKGFLLPMENQSQVCIILQLHKDKPIYQGQTLYRNIVCQIKKDIEVEAKSRLKDKDIEKYPNLSQIKQKYQGPMFQVVMDIIKATAQITLIAPDLKDFKSRSGQSCVKCGVKTQSGWLYFLKKSLIFITKPVIYFKIEEIKKVEFHRLGANNKQFDMKITLAVQKKAVEFMGIERNELDVLIQYFKARNVRIQMEEQVKKAQPDIAAIDDDDDEDDQDFEDNGEESDDDDSFSEEEDSGPQQKSSKKKEKKERKDKSGVKAEENVQKNNEN